MVCELRIKPKQTLSQRADEVRRAVEGLDRLIQRRRVKVVVGPQGAVTFSGWVERDDITDACAYRRLMSTGSSLTLMEIAKAEQMAGRGVDRRVIAQGIHSHDGGQTWDKE